MKITTISVEVVKMLSDGDYGHESVRVGYTADLEDGEDAETHTAVLLADARMECARELAESESLNVRRRISAKRRVCNNCGLELDDEERGYLHPECEDRVRAERAAARELARQEREAEERDMETRPALEEIPF